MHVQEIVNPLSVRGTHFLRIQEFYESLIKNYDALVMMGESDMLRGFVVFTLNKLPHVKPDLGQTDDNWETWGMEVKHLQRWLKRNRMKNSLELFEKTKGRRDIGALQRETTNHHRIKLKPHPSAYTANKVTGETIVKRTRSWRAEGSS